MNSSNSLTINKATIRLHTHPSADSFQITGIDGIASLIVSDLNCIPLLKKQITADEDISIEMLKKGVYIAKIITSSEIVERKLVKK